MMRVCYNLMLYKSKFVRDLYRKISKKNPPNNFRKHIKQVVVKWCYFGTTRNNSIDILQIIKYITVQML